MPRRTFCAGAAAALGLAACGGDPSHLMVGGLPPDGDAATSDPTDGGQQDDLASSSKGDLASSKADLSTTGASPDLAQTSGNTCAAGISGGAASAITASTPKYVSTAKAYVCRDAGGLYAMSALCTHAGCKVSLDTNQWYCPCHGATFDLNGQNPTAPAYSSLKHFEMCVDGSGNVQINTSKTVSASTRV